MKENNIKNNQISRATFITFAFLFAVILGIFAIAILQTASKSPNNTQENQAQSTESVFEIDYSLKSLPAYPNSILVETKPDHIIWSTENTVEDVSIWYLDYFENSDIWTIDQARLDTSSETNHTFLVVNDDVEIEFIISNEEVESGKTEILVTSLNY